MPIAAFQPLQMSLPLESFSIHAFRGLKEVELRNLGRINILVGRNNSGKTSVLEALATYARPLRPSEWIDVVRRRGISNSRSVLLDGLGWIFPRLDSEASNSTSRPREARLSGDGASQIREVTARLNEIEGFLGDHDMETKSFDESEFDTSGIKRGVQLQLLSKLKDMQASLFEGACQEREFTVELWENARGPVPQNTGEVSIEVSTITPFSHRMRNMDVEAVSASILNNTQDTLLSLLREFDSGIQDLEILKRQGSDAVVYVKHKRLGLSPLSTFGDGMRRALIIGASLASVRGGILLVDEIESAIHVEALKTTFQWLQRACSNLNVQLFATTHSLEAIDALIAAAEESIDLSVYRLEQREGLSHAKAFSREKLVMIREELGQEIRS